MPSPFINARNLVSRAGALYLDGQPVSNFSVKEVGREFQLGVGFVSTLQVTIAGTTGNISLPSRVLDEDRYGQWVKSSIGPEAQVKEGFDLTSAIQMLSDGRAIETKTPLYHRDGETYNDGKFLAPFEVRITGPEPAKRSRRQLAQSRVQDEGRKHCQNRR